MKKLLAIAALTAMSACAKPAPAPEADASSAAATSAPAAEVLAADGKSATGTYKVTMPDGMVIMEEVKPDGTYSATGADGKVLETGKWEQKSPSLYCYTKDEANAKQACNEEKIENGVWTAKDPAGNIATVVRVEG